MGLRDIQQQLIESLQQDAKQVFCAALTGIIANPTFVLRANDADAQQAVEFAFKVTAAWMKSSAEAAVEGADGA